MLPARQEMSAMFDRIKDLASDLEAVRAEVWHHTGDGQKRMNKVEMSYTAFVDHAIRRAKEAFTPSTTFTEKSRPHDDLSNKQPQIGTRNKGKGRELHQATP